VTSRPSCPAHEHSSTDASPLLNQYAYPLRLGLHRLPISEIPRLRGLASVLAGYDGPAELERGLDILLARLTTTLTPQAK